jgi:FimV-like protein
MVAATLLISLISSIHAAPPQARPVRDDDVGRAVGEALIRYGDEAHASLDPLNALALYRRALQEDSTSYAALWRAARESVNLGMLTSDRDERKRRAEDAVSFARRARGVGPSEVEGSEWLSIALGRLALEEGLKARARLAAEIRSAALETLALDSLNAGAHHVLGEWHAEIRRLSGIERWVAKTMLGVDDVGEASWDCAVLHLERSVALAPAALVHHLDLARTYLDLGREDDARRELSEVLRRPVLDSVDPLQKEAAQRLLDAM